MEIQWNIGKFYEIQETWWKTGNLMNALAAIRS